MALTPAEIRHVQLGRRLLGYDRQATDRLLEEIVASFEDVWRERADLRDEIEQLETELTRFKEVEATLRNALVSAERMADEVRAHAQREAEIVVAEARARARDITGAAEGECQRIEAEIRRLRTVEADMRADYRAFLLAAIDRIEGEPEERRRVPEQAA
jgi:cell division initiation protein